MNSRRIYTLTAIGRPLDPAYATNLAVLVLLPVVGVVMAGLHALALAGEVGWSSAVLRGVLVAFGSWALARELAPDDNAAAFLAMALSLAALLLFAPETVLPVFVALLLVRIVNRSTGLPPTPVDSALVCLLTLWAVFSLGQPLLGLTGGLAFALDATLGGGRRRQWLPAGACLLGSALALARGGAASVVGDAGSVAAAFAATTAVAYTAAILLMPPPEAEGDATGVRLDRTRVRAGMLVGLLAVAQSAVATSAGGAGFDVVGIACLFAVGISGVFRALLERLPRPPRSAVALTLSYTGLVAGGLIAAMVALYVPDPGGSAPRVIVSVDNSLWNRLGLNRLTYVRILRLEGLSPRVVNFDDAGESPDAGELLRGAQGLLLTGGGDVAAERYGGEPSTTLSVKPRRDELELELLEKAEQAGLPVLGLCRGAQVLNVYLGGTLGAFRDQSGRYRRHMRHVAGHTVALESGSRLADIYAPRRGLEVTTLHGQFVARPGRGVRITAYAPDGTPEAIEVGSGPAFGMLGVQWHAEVPPWDSRQRPLFAAFRDAVVAAAGQRQTFD